MHSLFNWPRITPPTWNHSIKISGGKLTILLVKTQKTTNSLRYACIMCGACVCVCVCVTDRKQPFKIRTRTIHKGTDNLHISCEVPVDFGARCRETSAQIWVTQKHTNAYWHYRLKNCMAHYSRFKNSWNWDRRTSNHVCVCVWACVCQKHIRHILHHMLSCFLVCFLFFFKCQSMKALARSHYLNWNQFSLPCASWMQIECINPNRSLSWLIWNFVCIIEPTNLVCIVEPRTLCREGQKKNGGSEKTTKEENREQWKYGAG